jgi:signal recognition particle subunit SRP72
MHLTHNPKLSFNAAPKPEAGMPRTLVTSQGLSDQVLVCDICPTFHTPPSTSQISSSRSGQTTGTVTVPSTPMASLARLLRAATIDDHEEILNAANAALQVSHDDISVQRTRVVALLKLDRFDDALRVLDDAGDKLREACALEKGYALYKTGRLGEVRACLPSHLVGADESLALSHLTAQVAYRTEYFKVAHDLYQGLASKARQGSSEERDLIINKTAAWAQLAWQNQGAAYTPVPDKLDTFELAYNAACASIACGRLSKATVLLDRATRLCDNSDLSDSEKQAEMLSIMAQQAYVYSVRGMEAEALSAYSRLSGTK